MGKWGARYGPGDEPSTFTLVHVIISLIGIVSGFIVLFGLFGSHRLPGMTALFLITTILTSVTGFLFPFDKLLPSHMVGIVSLIVLAIACFALYIMKLSGPWRWIYTLTAMIALYLNVFVLVIRASSRSARCMHWLRACRRASRPS